MTSVRRGADSRNGSSGDPGVLIALHGHDDHPSSALAWGRRIAPPDWQVITPSAPVGPDGARSWFDSGPRGVDAAQLEASISRVEAVVGEARHRASRVVIAGFSQGGALALAMAWNGTAADRVVGMCAFLPESSFFDGGGSEAAAGPPSRPKVMVLGTADDESVPAFMGSDAAAVLQSLGHDVTSHVVAGTHHVDANLAAIASGFATGGMARVPYFSLSIPVDRVGAADEFIGAYAITETARGYERLGFHAAYVTDHPAPDDRWLEGGGHHALEPAAVLGAVAAATTDLKLHTNVYVLPYRNPFLAAKALASVDVMSGGRLIAGVAAGYVRPEFATLGSDFDGRGAVMEQSLGVLPEVWSGRSVQSSGPGWHSRGTTSQPATNGGPPIWVGGNSVAALRRAVTMAQGWSPFPTPAGSGRGLRTAEIVDLDDLRGRLARADQLCLREGRLAPLTICFVPFAMTEYVADPVGGLQRLVDEIGQLHDLGVDWFPLVVPGATRPEMLDNAGALAEALSLRSRQQ